MSDNITSKRFVLEQYTLILKHEIVDDGETVEIELPIIARYVLPLSDKYTHDIQSRPYILDKVIADLVQVVRNKAMEE